jgi:hypothetical protein
MVVLLEIGGGHSRRDDEADMRDLDRGNKLDNHK